MQSTVAARLIDIVVVRGKSNGISIYEIVGESEGLDMELREFLQLYNQGMRSYLGRDWSGASRKFSATLEINPRDKPSGIMLERCRKYTENPPPNDWTGVIVMREK